MGYWQSLGTNAPAAENHLAFPLVADGAFHRHVIDLSSSPSYRGSLARLRLDPVASGGVGDWIQIRSLRLLRDKPGP